jgi:membrane dipeptidase
VDPAFCQRPGGARARVLALFDAFDQLMAAHPAAVAHTRDGAALRAAQHSGKIAAILGIEGGHAIENSLDVLEEYGSRGLRVMTLVWNNHLSWVRSSAPLASGSADANDSSVPRGLSAFGVQVVERMNELGILVDLSHTSERAFHDAVSASAAPTMASHSGCKALHDHPRNLSDAQLKHIAERGGVVGLPFLPSFLDAEAAQAAEAIRKESGYRALCGKNDTALGLLQTEYLRGRVAPLGMERLVDHIVHVAEVAGPGHVALGSDFDGIVVMVDGLEDAACYPHLLEPLEGRGFSSLEIEGILGGNMARVFGEATASVATSRI